MRDLLAIRLERCAALRRERERTDAAQAMDVALDRLIDDALRRGMGDVAGIPDPAPVVRTGQGDYTRDWPATGGAR